MKNNYILLERVNLYYSSVAFKERSLKSLLGGFFSLNRTKPEIHDVHAKYQPGNQAENTCRLGHNGAGKTFLKMLAGISNSGSTRIVEGTVRSLFDLSIG
jgi:lipopolysaccharide transport system ATP-binding protein